MNASVLGTGPPEAVRWTPERDAVDILDQTLLPETERRIRLHDVAAAEEAIRALRVRGAPAIGIAAAMGLAVEMARHVGVGPAEFAQRLAAAAARLRAARPTAVNLAWALRRVLAAADGAGSNEVAVERLHDEATRILEEDRDMCRRIGEHALGFLPDGARLLTHCNAGALATGGTGTALAPIYLAHGRGRRIHVYAPETRPLLQGSRLTAWELQRAGIEVTVLPDSAAALLLRDGSIDLVLVGADRIAANGDVANKVGTYALAVLASHHGVPFCVAAPTSTIDADMPSGAGIPIEVRGADEVRRGFGRLTAPADAPVFAPAFDVTPAALIRAIITEEGVHRPPFEAALGALMAVRSRQGGGEGRL